MDKQKIKLDLESDENYVASSNDEPHIQNDGSFWDGLKNHLIGLRDWAIDHKPLAALYIFLIFVLLTAISWGVYAIFFKKAVTAPDVSSAEIRPGAPKIVAPAPPPPAPKPKSPLTGIEVDNDAVASRQVTAIMIENSPSARPQSGLKTAGVVFEAIAEGGITRFLALYQESRPGLIGPVRSVRPYYVDWFKPFDAAIAHVGGSYNALNEVRSGKYKDIDEFFNGSYYWRATDRYAPHNVYTNFDKLDALNQSKGFAHSTFNGFPRKGDAPAATPDATKIDINVSGYLYNVHYDYDKASNTYLRSEAMAPHNDREGGRLTPKVAIVMKVPMHQGFEDGYREQMDTIGSGQAYIFQDGTITQGTWNKPDKATQISFKDQSNNPISLNAGQTWITVTPTEQNTTWSP